MSMVFHFVDVACGNMVLIVTPDGQRLVCDCNITEINEKRVLATVDAAFGGGAAINAFINTHRDADHMRGIEKLHRAHPIHAIWDTGVAGTDPSSSEYGSYMDLRRRLASQTLAFGTGCTFGQAQFACWGGAWDGASDANDQSAVIRFQYAGTGVLLAGDTSYRPWEQRILPTASAADLRSDILLAAHHGSLAFFDDQSRVTRFIGHIETIGPAMTLISVGPGQNLPHPEAVSLYRMHSRGSRQGERVWTTEDRGTMVLTIDMRGRWNLSNSR